MNPKLNLIAFAALLAIAFGGAALAGDAFGPEPSKEPRGQHSEEDQAMPAATHEETSAQDSHGGGHAEPAAHPVRGLAVAENGLRLVVETPEVARGQREPLTFRIVDDTGETVRDFDVEHEKRMHLILARRDLTGFQHLHPRQLEDGSWTTDVTVADAGSYRVFADFKHEGEAATLAADLRVDGRADLRDLPAPAELADAGDGYQVRLDAGRAVAGKAAELRFTILKDGHAVHVEPYLGAGGHLVALREGDLAFLHVHPTGHGDDHGGGGEDAHDDAIGFEATFPTEGRYRLFLQFKHEGRVHTAAFTHEVTK